MKYALIGCGRIAINHLRGVAASNLEVIAMCDLVEENIDSLVERAGFSGSFDKYTDYKMMLKKKLIKNINKHDNENQ